MEVVPVTGINELTLKLDSCSNRFAVLFFYVDDSAECSQMSDIVTELQKEAKNEVAVIFKINASKDEEICKRFNVTEAPAFIFIDSQLLGGEVADKVIGANVPLFLKKFGENVEQLQKFKDRLKELINKAPIMLFMKGNRSTPRCGFSKQAIALLENYKAKYDTFDILEDLEVREGLKKFSNWPTYPQLYVKGELIGGLDILKDYAESGELEQMLSVD